jgi:hypothetical protein
VAVGTYAGRYPFATSCQGSFLEFPVNCGVSGGLRLPRPGILLVQLARAPASASAWGAIHPCVTGQGSLGPTLQ